MIASSEVASQPVQGFITAIRSERRYNKNCTSCGNDLSVAPDGEVVAWIGRDDQNYCNQQCEANELGIECLGCDDKHLPEEYSSKFPEHIEWPVCGLCDRACSYCEHKLFSGYHKNIGWLMYGLALEPDHSLRTQHLPVCPMCARDAQQ